MKASRRYLRQELAWGQAELSACAYWKIGVAEDLVVREPEE